MPYIAGCFYDDSLEISLVNHNPKDADNSNEIYGLKQISIDEKNYQIFYLFKGNCTVKFEDRISKADESALAFADYNQKFSVYLNNREEFSYLYIKIDPLFFKNIIGDFDFTRAFSSKKQLIYPKKENLDIMSCLFESMKKSLINHLGPIHIYCRINAIISELDILFDEQQKSDEVATDNIEVKLNNYIRRHFKENLTLSKLEKKFYLSSTSINAILKRNVGFTFLGYLNALRLKCAIQYMDEGLLSFKKIAELSGFSDYTAFYRTYKKKYGTFPSENKKLK